MTLQRLVLPRPADAEPEAPPLTTFRLFSFAVAEQGVIISPELDELELQLKLEKTPEPTAEATEDPLLGMSGPTPAGTQETLSVPIETGEATMAATSEGTGEAAPSVITDAAVMPETTQDAAAATVEGS